MEFLFTKSKAKGMEEYGSIKARVRTNGQNKTFAIGYRIKESEWQKICNMSYVPNNILTSACMKYSQFANILSRIKLGIEANTDAPQLIPTIISNVKTEVLTGEVLTLPDSCTSGSMLLSECIKTYREDLRTGKRLKRKKSVKVSEGYISNVSKAISVLARYENSCQQQVHLDDVTMSFQRSFVAFMRDEGLLPNTIYTRMSVIRVVMEAAYLDKLTRVDDFRNPEFVPCQEETDTIWFTPEQIEALINMDLSSQEAVAECYKKAKFTKKRLAQLPRPSKVLAEYLAYSRDIFIVGCLTGQRYSDYTRICKEMIVKLDGAEFISLRQVKTGTKVLIPIDKRVRQILNRYHGKLPYVSSLTYSKHIKLLAELLGYTYKPEFDRQNSSASKQRFCDMVTTHTCRRSFTTNAYAAGIPLASIMAITGHASEKNLRRYLKLQAEDKAVIAARDFKGFIQHP